MKKNIFKFVALFFAVGFLFSCQEDEVFYDVNGNNTLAGFVNERGNLAVFETGLDSYEIEVGVTTVSNVDRTIALTINNELTTALPTEYSIDNATLNVPAGSFVGKVLVKGNFAALAPTVTKVLVLELADVTGGNVSNDNKRFALSIFPACEYNRDSFIGSYEAVRGANIYDVEITAGEGPNDLLIQNIHGAYPSSVTKITLSGDVSNPVISFPTWTNNFLYTDTQYGFAGVDPAPGTTSTFDTCLDKLVLNYRIRVNAGTFAAVSVTLTKF